MADHDCARAPRRVHHPSPPITSRLAVFLVAIGLPSLLCLFPLYLIVQGLRSSRPLPRAAAALALLWPLIDSSRPSSGGAPRPWLWRWSAPFWNAYRAYFPARALCAPPLDDEHKDEKRPCLVLAHPHGIWGCSVWSFLFWGCTGGMDPALAAREPRTATLALNFFAPVWREYIMSLGLISASAASIASVLSRGGCVVLVPGGAAEAMLSQPGDVYTLFLRKRRGYARLALEHGASLVPVFSFGENELYGLRGEERERQRQSQSQIDRVRVCVRERV